MELSRDVKTKLQHHFTEVADMPLLSFFFRTCPTIIHHHTPSRTSAHTITSSPVSHHREHDHTVIMPFTMQVKKAVSGGKLVELGDMWLAFYSRLPARVRAEIQQPSTLPLVAALLEDHYHTLLHTLLPDVFQFVPTARSKAIRSVAKQVDDCMRAALNGYDPEFVHMAVTHASAFGFVCLKSHITHFTLCNDWLAKITYSVFRHT
jgi:hypothetical protein